MIARVTQTQLGRVFLSAASGGAGAFLAALAPLITTPIMLAYLGDYRYGLWMMLMSITALIGLSDFGITNGITTELSHKVDDSAARRRLISNAYGILGLVSAALALMLALYHLAAPLWPAGEADPTLALMVVAVLAPTIASVPLGFVLRLLYIDMRGVEASFAPGIAAILSVLIAIAGTEAGLSPYLLVFLFLATVPAVYLALTLRYFRRHRELAPRLSDRDPATARRILRSGQGFVLLSLLIILCNKLDYLIVAQIVGVVDLVPYAIADRIIGIANTAVTVLGASLWPVFAQKTRDGDVAWLKSSIIRINVATVILYLVFTAVLLAVYDPLLELWLGKPLETSPYVLIFLSMTSMVIALTSPYFALANSVGAVREQMGAYVALLALGLPMKCVAGLTLGTAGVAGGAFASWAFVMLPLIAFIAWRRLKSDNPCGSAGMKILVTGHVYYHLGNAAKFRILEVVRALQALGHDVTLFDGLSPEPAMPYGESQPQRYERAALPVGRMASAVRKGGAGFSLLQHPVAHERFDVVYCYGSELSWLIAAARLARRCGARFVVDVPELYGFEGMFASLSALRTRLGGWAGIFPTIPLRADHVVVPSARFVSLFRRFGCKVTLLPPFFAGLSAVETLPRAPGVRTLAYAGSPSNKERLPLIMQALAAMTIPEGGRIDFNLVGLDEADVRAIAREAGVEQLLDRSNVRIAARGKTDVETARSVVQRSDFAIVVRNQSRRVNFGFPSKVAEAFRLGTPIISNVYSDIADYLDDRRNGLLLMQGDLSDLRTRLEECMAMSDGDLDAMRAEAARTGDEHFSAARAARSLSEALGA